MTLWFTRKKCTEKILGLPTRASVKPGKSMRFGEVKTLKIKITILSIQVIIVSTLHPYEWTVTAQHSVYKQKRVFTCTTRPAAAILPLTLLPMTTSDHCFRFRHTDNTTKCNLKRARLYYNLKGQMLQTSNVSGGKSESFPRIGSFEQFVKKKWFNN